MAGRIFWEETLRHEEAGDLPQKDQVPLRAGKIRELLAGITPPLVPLAVVGRGGPLRPLEGGTYRVNDRMIEDLLENRWSRHASNLGAPLAREFAGQWKVEAFVVDPVTVDNFTDVARVSGVPGIERRSRSHALNIRSCAHVAAAETGKPLAVSKFVIAHLGGGFSIAAVDGGHIVDVNDALLGMGPFSVERAGALPLEPLIDMAYSGEYTADELKKLLSKNSGMKGYLGTNQLPEAEAAMDAGDEKADLIFRAMIYQIAKEIGACAAALKGSLDAVVLTGGLANSERVVRSVGSYVDYLGRLLVYPGEREMEALAAGAFRVIKGIEEAKEY